MKRTNGRAYGR